MAADNASSMLFMSLADHAPAPPIYRLTNVSSEIVGPWPSCRFQSGWGWNPDARFGDGAPPAGCECGRFVARCAADSGFSTTLRARSAPLLPVTTVPPRSD